VQLVWAAALVLVVPGYAISVVILPTMSRVDRALASVAISIAIAIAASLAMNAAGIPLERQSWAAALGAVGLIASGIGVVRGRRMPMHPHMTGSRPTFRQAFLLMVGGVLTIGALVTAAIGSQTPTRPGFTQFWMLPDANRSAASVGIASQEHEAMTYRVTITMDNELVTEWGEIRLDPGAHWERIVRLPAGDADAVFVARLYRAADEALPYREVSMRSQAN
jgi:hypothetical protein